MEIEMQMEKNRWSLQKENGLSRMEGEMKDEEEWVMSVERNTEEEDKEEEEEEKEWCPENHIFRKKKKISVLCVCVYISCLFS